MKIMKKKNQKPIEIDAYLKYRCPYLNCGQNHWLTLKESQTKKFKIVCDCGNILIPKRIDKIKIKYVDDKRNIIKEKSLIEAKQETIEAPIPERLLVICSKTLTDYGFTTNEAHSLLKQSYVLNPTDNPLELINNTLKIIGNIDNATTETN